MKTTKISEEALAVLSGGGITAGSPTLFKIEGGQLDRKLYVEVNKVLEELGGVWSRKHKGHEFTLTPEEVSERLDATIESGEIVLARKNGFFPTPAALADELVERATLRNDGMRILEPSAGDGSLVDAILRALGKVHISNTIRLIEVDPVRAGILKNKYQDQPTILLAETDFLTWSVEEPQYAYDRIVMNPPFENRADAIHVLHAYDLLKDGGRLVAITSASVKFRREKEYQRVRELATRILDIPAGSFKESGTMVNTAIVIIDK